MTARLNQTSLPVSLQVIMGGGRRNFMTNDSKDPEEDELYGRRNDGRDLIAEWQSLRPKDRSRYVWNQTEFNKVDVNKIDNLLGKYTGT